MDTSNTNNQNLFDEDEMDFLHQLKKEFLLEREEDAIPFLASVLQTLRQTLTLENANALLNTLPDFLKLVFACNWPHHEEKANVEHLDEFVNLVMERDQREGKFIFKSELQTLSIVIITLKKLFKFIDLEKFEGLAPAFKLELQKASTEIAVA